MRGSIREGEAVVYSLPNIPLSFTSAPAASTLICFSQNKSCRRCCFVQSVFVNIMLHVYVAFVGSDALLLSGSLFPGTDVLYQLDNHGNVISTVSKSVPLTKSRK